MRVPLIAANWKMNKLVAETSGFFECLSSELGGLAGKVGVGFEIVVAPPYTHLGAASALAAPARIGVCAQNCGVAKSGAFTGEISPDVLIELGCRWSLIGHSERRHVFQEDAGILLKRLRAGLDAGLGVIYCVGETLEERRAGQALAVLETQLALVTQLPLGSIGRVVVAYEPVWAIGTGENATPVQAQEVHHFIREWASNNFTPHDGERLRILYGGSVKPDNASSLMGQSDVDGFLVGGASLDAKVFAQVIVEGLKGKNRS